VGDLVGEQQIQDADIPRPDQVLECRQDRTVEPVAGEGELDDVDGSAVDEHSRVVVTPPVDRRVREVLLVCCR
jgi:hypothetical protein